MRRDYDIGDIITIRGRQYEVRPRSDFDSLGFCYHCAFLNRKGIMSYCALKKFYSHFLLNCSNKDVYFKRI